MNPEEERELRRPIRQDGRSACATAEITPGELADENEKQQDEALESEHCLPLCPVGGRASA